MSHRNLLAHTTESNLSSAYGELENRHQWEKYDELVPEKLPPSFDEELYDEQMEDRQRRRCRSRPKRATHAPKVYARLPRWYCKSSRQLLKPFVVGVLGSVLILAWRGQTEISRRTLLHMAGSGNGGAAMQHLAWALEVLLKPVGEHPPPLLSVKEGRRLTLKVNPEWLPITGYVKVAWPPPKDALVLSLYLFLVACAPRRNDERGVTLKGLRAALGYSRDHFKRDLKAALVAVNKHREAHDLDACRCVPWLNKNTVRFSLKRDGKNGTVEEAVKRGRKSRETRS